MAREANRMLRISGFWTHCEIQILMMFGLNTDFWSSSCILNPKPYFSANYAFQIGINMHILTVLHEPPKTETER
jgi:hypothetical protein